ncbi:MAG: MarR family transcriptional regulator [Cyclobacteriaceae bacterium]
MKSEMVDLDKTLLPWMGRTMKAIDFLISDLFKASGLELTKAQVILLRVLTKNDGQPQQNLAFITDRDKTSLTRLINTMEKKGLVVRKQSEQDKRINKIFITKEGFEVMKKAIPIIQKAVGVIQEGVSGKELKRTIEVLKKVSKNVNAEELTAPLNN